jgi:hypothetical protein
MHRNAGLPTLVNRVRMRRDTRLGPVCHRRSYLTHPAPWSFWLLVSRKKTTPLSKSTHPHALPPPPCLQTPVCGTEADLQTQPPAAAFVPLSQLMRAMIEGSHYAPVTRADLMNPLAQRLLGTRTRATAVPLPVAAGAAPAPVAAPAAPTPVLVQPQVQVQPPPHPTPVTVVAAQPATAAPMPTPVVVTAAAGVPFPGLPHLMARPMQMPPHMMAGGPMMMRPRPVGQYVVPNVVYSQPYNPAAGAGTVQQPQPYYTGAGAVMVTPVLAAPPQPPAAQ